MRRSEAQSALCRVINTLQLAILAPATDPVRQTLNRLRAIETVLRSAGLPDNYSFVVRSVLVRHLRRLVDRAMWQGDASLDHAFENLADPSGMTLPHSYNAVLRELERLSVAKSDFDSAPRADHRVAVALTRIRDSSCGSRPPKLCEVARTVNLSRWHLERLIKQQTGRRFSELARETRVTHAFGLLQMGSLSIKEISAKLGYDYPTHFNRDFRRVTGVTPTQWRNTRLRTF